MFRRFAVLMTFSAWLLATGSHWDLVQVFAWGRMFASNAQTMPVMAAAQKTFSPEARCRICKAVAQAKQESAASHVPGTEAAKEILLANAPAALVCFSPAVVRVGLLPAMTVLASAAPPEPLLTPPRGQA